MLHSLLSNQTNSVTLAPQDQGGSHFLHRNYRGQLFCN
jgi:hypothetical protein